MADLAAAFDSCWAVLGDGTSAAEASPSLAALRARVERGMEAGGRGKGAGASRRRGRHLDLQGGAGRAGRHGGMAGRATVWLQCAMAHSGEREERGRMTVGPTVRNFTILHFLFFPF